ncbi:hypothetical protein BKA65DRAFT_519637 [Rhexocercosporidium sp. MPI-PUGE-AT-0058]|nr:hypothetical protein BKA65DRAFT_519637 [Rhexocercosporidium sp. MPI-PUGE-AT-0058]
MILSLTNSTSAIILSLLGVFFPQNRKILYGSLSLATFGFLSRVTDALLSTVIAGTLTFMTNKFGKPIGVTAKVGSTFIGLIWLGLACQFLASSYWARIWFVEFRQTSYRIREREAHEVGNYKNVRAEFRTDRKFPKEEKDLGKSLKAVR